MPKAPELTQADLDNALKHAIRHCSWTGEGERPRWSVVMKLTGHGSTYAQMLCVWAGENPDDPIQGACNACSHPLCTSCGEVRGGDHKDGVCQVCTNYYTGMPE